MENSKIPHTIEKVNLAYERDENRKSHPINKIEIEFVASVAPELQGRAERALRLVSPNCPVIQTLSADVEIVETVKFN